MNADSVGIYAPYDFDEQTYAAKRIAHFVEAKGYRPEWMACKPVTNAPFHYHWDVNVVRNPSSKGIGSWLESRRVIVWFEFNKQLLTRAKDHAIKNIYVPMVHRMEAGRLRDYQMFEQIACPNYMSYEILHQAGLRNCFYTGWDSGYRLANAKQKPSSDIEKVLVIPEWPLTNEWGMLLAYTMRQLMDAEPVNVTVVQFRNWPKLAGRAINELNTKHCGCFQVVNKPTCRELYKLYEKCGWVIYLSERTNIGVRLHEAYTFGLPVIALDLAPAKEIVKHNNTGYLVKCETMLNHLRVPTAVPNTHNTFESIRRLVGDRKNWYELTSYDRSEVWNKRRDLFIQSWSELLSYS